MSAIGKATNELGKLFVDIGLGGVGKTLKGLNSVSASFLLTKEAVKGMLSPMKLLFKTLDESGKHAMHISKLNTTLGASLTTVQQLSQYLARFGMGEGLIGNLGEIMDMLNDVNLGFSAVNGEFVNALARLGLNWQEYRGGTFEDMLKMVEDVWASVQDLPIGQQRAYFNKIGLPTELLYALQKGDFNLRDALLIPEENIKRAEEYEQNLNNLGQTWKQLKTNIGGGIASPVTKSIEDLNKTMMGDTQAAGRTVVRGGATVAGGWAGTQAGAAIGSAGGPVGTAVGGLLGGAIGSIGSYYGTSGVLSNDKLIPLSNEEIKAIEGYKDIPIKPDRKSAINGLNISVQNQNNIYSNDAQEVADRIAGITKEDIVDAEDNAFQLSNMAGA